MAGSIEELQGIVAALASRVQRLERIVVMQHRALKEARGEARVGGHVATAVAQPALAVAGGALPSRAGGSVSAFEAMSTARSFTPINDSTFPEILFAEDEPAPPAAPVKLEVQAALERYAHVVEALTLLWKDKSCDEYLDTLVIDKRGNRRGFPADAMNEILFLVELRLVQYGRPQHEPRQDRHR